MAAPYLPDDCIYCILKFLQNHRSTLFNCLLVNRFWCKAAVPLLYADPFNSTRNYSIIPTLILCFNKTEILQLRNQLQLINIDKIHTSDECKPLFEYIKYLENFDYSNIDLMIFHWLNLLPAPPYYIESEKRKKLRENFIPVFYQSILYKCNDNNIKRLSISPYFGSYKNGNIQNFTSKLTKLNTLCLSCNYIWTDSGIHEIAQEFLSNIANICLNLRKLEISLAQINNPVKENICSIIQNQKNLRMFKLSYCYSSFLNDIFLSLTVQKYSLVYIEFNGINIDFIPFKNFASLCNLKYLKFECCKGKLSLNQNEVLKCTSSFKLERLYFILNKWDHNFTTPLMIKYFGKSLKELILNDPLNILIIENISIYCPILITLEIKIKSTTDYLPVFPYFKNLTMRILNLYDNWLSRDIKIFKMLADNLSTSIKEVTLYFYTIKGPAKLRQFLENCHDCLERINLNYSINSELELIIEIILNYIERSNDSLKFLGITEKVLNGEKLKLLDQIKAKGVKIEKIVYPIGIMYKSMDFFDM